VQVLNDTDTPQDTFTIKSDDGTEKTVTITVQGKNDAAVIAGTTEGEVTETTDRQATGTLTSTDVDNEANKFNPNVVQNGTYGTLTITDAGAWTYTLNDLNAEVNALNTDSAPLKDTVTVATIDGTQQEIVITINGTNDDAIIGGDTSGKITENATNPISGKLTSTDVDNDDDTFKTAVVTQGIYGTLTIAADGKWGYTLNNANANVDALNSGDLLTDTITVASIDGTKQDIQITINGANDKAIITGDTAANIDESTTVTTFTSVTGDLNATDVDNTTGFKAVGIKISDSQYGKYAVTAAGGWTYFLNNSDLTVQALNVGDDLEDSFTVLTDDGTEQKVTITIKGGNDPAIFTGTAVGNITEDAEPATVLGVLNPDATNGTAKLQADGSVLFTPEQGFKGTVTLTYDVSDGEAVLEGETRTFEVVSPRVPSNVFNFRQYVEYNANEGVPYVGPSLELEIGRVSLALLFDETYYLANNRDIVTAIANPAFGIQTGYQHFIVAGVNEGRNPSPLFIEEAYLGSNPDIANAVANDLFGIDSGFEHFFRTGRAEGRALFTADNLNQFT
jgi:VCBS repeat-containing protein